jgi:hypothetical protein
MYAPLALNTGIPFLNATRHTYRNHTWAVHFTSRFSNRGQNLTNSGINLTTFWEMTTLLALKSMPSIHPLKKKQLDHQFDVSSMNAIIFSMGVLSEEPFVAPGVARIHHALS